MKILAEIIAGSHLYGLNTVSSDVDIRGVFLNTDPAKILGLERFSFFKKLQEDTIFFELCHFLNGLKKTNTQMIEFLFAEESCFKLITDEFKHIKDNKYKLIDSQFFYKSLIGYIQNEKRLANGERSGKLGGKRKNDIEKYGFSPKNFSHLFRLAYCGCVFFETDHYPVSIMKENKSFGNFLLDVKTKPENYSKENLNKIFEELLEKMIYCFKNKKNNFNFDNVFANNLCKKLYLPYIKN